MRTNSELMSLEKQVALAWQPFLQELGLKKKALYGLRSTYSINQEFTGIITVSPFKDSAGVVSVCVNLHLHWNELEKLYLKLLQTRSQNFGSTITESLGGLIPDNNSMFWVIRLSETNEISMKHIAEAIKKYGFKHMRQIASEAHVLNVVRNAVECELKNPILNNAVKWPIMLALAGRKQEARDFIASHMQALCDRVSSLYETYRCWYAPRLLRFLETNSMPDKNTVVEECSKLSPSSKTQRVRKHSSDVRPDPSFLSIFDSIWAKKASLALPHFELSDPLLPGLEYELRNDGSFVSTCRVFITIKWPQLEHFLTRFYTELPQTPTFRVEASRLLDLELPRECDCSSEHAMRSYIDNVIDQIIERLPIPDLRTPYDLSVVMEECSYMTTNPWQFNNLRVRLPIALLLASRQREALAWVSKEQQAQLEVSYPAFEYYQKHYLPQINYLLTAED